MKSHLAILIAALTALTLASAANAAILSVDFSQDTDDPLQDGFVGFSFPSDANPHTLSYASSAATDGTIDVTLAGQTHFRDYAAITGGPFVGLSNLLSDSALRNADGVMTLTLGDLQAGTYEITTYHHSTQYGSPLPTFDVYLTDAAGTDVLKFSDQTVYDSTSPTDITTLTFSFVSDGASDIVIDMDVTAVGRQFKFNGFELTPEPATMAILAAGLPILLKRRRRS